VSRLVEAVVRNSAHEAGPECDADAVCGIKALPVASTAVFQALIVGSGDGAVAGGGTPSETGQGPREVGDFDTLNHATALHSELASRGKNAGEAAHVDRDEGWFTGNGSRCRRLEPFLSLGEYGLGSGVLAGAAGCVFLIGLEGAGTLRSRLARVDVLGADGLKRVSR